MHKNNFFGVPPIRIQKYERYLPTAFDESMSILEKINKVIHYLHDYSEITEEMLTKWNEVYKWITGEGLYTTVEEILKEWLKDGTFEQLLEKLIVDLQNDFNELRKELKKHIDDEEIHRKITFKDSKDEGNIILSPSPYHHAGMVLLDEVHLYSEDGTVGGGKSLYISPEFVGKAHSFIVEVFGGIVNRTEKDFSALVLRINRDNNENYHHYFHVTDYKGELDIDLVRDTSTSFPRVGVLGDKLGYTRINYTPVIVDKGSRRPKINSFVWSGDSWGTYGSTPKGQSKFSKCAGRWEGNFIDFYEFSVRTFNYDDKWLKGSYAKLWGVL